MRKAFLALLTVTAAHAAIQYAGGTNVNTTFTTTTGTRQEIVTGMQTALTSAGWTVISGGGSGDVLMESALTPQSLQARVRLLDPGSGNCARLHFRNVANTRSHTGGLFLLPAAAKVFRVIANRYQFFVFVAGGTAREFAAGGVPFVPSFVSITEAIWAWGNAVSDGDTTTKPALGETLQSVYTTAGAGIGCNFWNATNGAQWEHATGTGTLTPGVPTIVMPTAALRGGMNSTFGFRWFDDSAFISEPLIAWGSSAATEAKVIGQLWDGLIFSNSMAQGTTFTLDSKTWYAITNNNAGRHSGQDQSPGTLCHVIP